MREVHLSLFVVEGAEVHDARRSRAFQQIWNGRKKKETLTAVETTKRDILVGQALTQEQGGQKEGAQVVGSKRNLQSIFGQLFG